jgi:tetratricopeptide (TPR) repeat protein
MRKQRIKPVRNNKSLLFTGAILIIAISSGLAFLPCLENGFTNWDDNLLVTQNPKIRKIDLNHIGVFFNSFHFAHYHPLVLLSFALEYRFFGLNPAAYHATNVVLHILCALLVFWLFYSISSKISVALITSLLFGIHPMKVESVAWIAERKDVLYAFFYLGAMISYVYYVKKGSLYLYFVTLGLFLFSLLSKAMAVTLPFLFFAFDYGLERVWGRKVIWEKIPFILLSVIFGIIAIIAHNPSGDQTLKTAFSLLDNIFLASYAAIFYPFKIFFPFTISCVYPYPEESGGHLPLMYLISPMILVLLIFGIIWAGKRCTTKIYFGSLVFFIPLLPILKLVPFGAAITADRFIYVSSLGIFYLLAEGAVFLYKKSGNSMEAKIAVITTSIVMMGGLFYLTENRCRVWKDDITLWNDALKKYPRFATGYNNRGNAFHQKGDPAQAISDYNEALRLDPQYARAYFNRGNSLFDMNQTDRALGDINKALEIDPGFPEAYNNRGFVYTHLREYGKAIEDFNKAIGLRRDYAEAYYNRGWTFGQTGDLEKAISDFKKTLEIDPLYPDAHNNLGLVYSLQKDYDRAIGEYTKEIEFHPDSARAYANRSMAYFEKGEKDLARRDLDTMRQSGFSVNPRLFQALKNSGTLP